MISVTVSLRREELYEQVWSEPMSKLAKRYGISDVALAKICRKMDIPVPSDLLITYQMSLAEPKKNRYFQQNATIMIPTRLSQEATRIYSKHGSPP